ncbi:hypothetical protein Q7C_2317 [Methylophaga frappieri]|uniref:Uncharacterized protein n=1 Tax=Methylophaga frappieri (strain ATCC BAA-2434 / DSM 25690 / JAM7) TaxID=754477 RepID=I1YKK8_METFJ|nr:hypothetical protein [Methylophaga frappieri]AFJ03451.1 hypothetical protein Q7C_2317 [Methylophaga frappieri]
MARLRFPHVYGTNSHDEFITGDNQITFGYAGNDSFTSYSYTDYNFMVGGKGDDHY